MERLIHQLPRFFSPGHLILLAEAMGTTLALTLIGCVTGFLLAFLLVFLRRTPGILGFPLRLIAILYVEIFRRIPFLVVTYLVLFFIQAFVSDASLFTIAVVAICIYATAYTADIIRGGFESVARQQIEAATAMNFSRWQTLTARHHSAVLAGHPAAGGRLRRQLHQGYGPGLPGRRLRADLPRQGAEQRGLFRHPRLRHHLLALFRHVLSAEPLGPLAGETPCTISKSEISPAPTARLAS